MPSLDSITAKNTTTDDLVTIIEEQLMDLYLSLPQPDQQQDHNFEYDESFRPRHRLSMIPEEEEGLRPRTSISSIRRASYVLQPNPSATTRHMVQTKPDQTNRIRKPHSKRPGVIERLRSWHGTNDLRDVDIRLLAPVPLGRSSWVERAISPGRSQTMDADPRFEGQRMTFI
ncbi:hypothetical protein TWF694_005743 [Orbilia ellipsospora]|uniref:Uncharacterized protein n=1 Tax=Orbilia ellipsospora TaxID=2528407 RepID=A0AAV9WS08_9PEZI